ncbi:hypothetical protein [Alteraurantiacibacter palmitatis]|uniref:Uncharacterized protein n=1 Tax=Alteraurantiacibacter palmitatis TaxID=2054628 RepID=A0ABV7E3N7_9SPHN
MNTIAASLGQARKSQGIWFAGIAIFVAAWFAIYNQLLPFAQWLVAQLPIEQGSHWPRRLNSSSTIRPRC